MIFFNILAILTLSYWIAMSIESKRGLPLIQELPLTTKLKDEPFVSIIVAAKEEEDSIEQTVQHLLAQDYDNMELIVINDRSNDQTGQKLEELKAWSANREKLNKRIQVIHITHLPEGWLGKNHALYQGYLQAKGKYLLFTDADVLYGKNTLSSAIHYMRSKHLDHLTLAPAMTANSFWLRSFVHLFLFSFGLFMKPWQANRDDQRKEGMGIGAFNLITRSAYEQIGTHKRFALRPDDDLKLGREAKKAGLKQRILTGLQHLQVEWYPDLPSAIEGLEKNTFVGLHYRLWMVIVAVFGQFFALFFPFIAVWLFYGDWKAILYLFSLSIMIGLYIAHIRKMTTDWGYEVLVLPITVLIFIYTLLRSTYLTLKQGGIYWRGTFYSLQDLKKMKE